MTNVFDGHLCPSHGTDVPNDLVDVWASRRPLLQHRGYQCKPIVMPEAGHLPMSFLSRSEKGGYAGYLKLAFRIAICPCSSNGVV